MNQPQIRFPIEPAVGQFQRRYKRFFADVVLSGETVVAHVANTGSLKSCLFPGEAALLSPASNPERKLKFSLEALQTPWKTWVGVNTSWPNALVKKVFELGLNPDWKGFTSYKPEHKISKETRLDGLLQDSAGRQRFIEIKNVTMAVGDCQNLQGTAQFPDGVTERGKKHLIELMKLVALGHQAELVFIVQRSDCIKFRPAWDIDPDYCETLVQAVNAGVKVSIWPVQISPEGLRIETLSPLSLDFEKA